jgi:MoxR-like ATPase
MMRLSLGYPDRDAELTILAENPSENALNQLEPVISAQDFLAARNEAAGLFCHPTLLEAIADIVRDTRIHHAFLLGASPRAGLHFLAAARALALIRGRTYVTDEDLIAIAAPVLLHRLRLKETLTAEAKVSGEKLIREICLARLEARK